MKVKTAVAWQAGKSLEEINRAFDLMHEGNGIRSVITF